MGADTADSPTDNTDGDTTNEETNEDADTEDIGISDNTSNEGDSSSNEGDNTDNNGDAEVEPVIPKKKKKASKAPTFSPTSPTVAPTLSLEQIFKNSKLIIIIIMFTIKYLHSNLYINIYKIICL